MNQISVLIVVDTEGAIASHSLKDNVYCVDNEGYLGSWQEGTNSLRTICKDGQQISWSVTSINATDSVSLVKFDGQMLTSHVCKPEKVSALGEVHWVGQVQSRGQFASFTYSCTLQFEGKSMSFSAAIKDV